MKLAQSRFFRVFLVPAAVFQSVIVGGGYGTGREVVEYISQFGAFGGLMGLVVIALSFGLILALSFELSRLYGVSEYRGFFKLLLGRAWVSYEVLFVLILLLVLAVTASAASSILEDSFGLNRLIGIAIILGAVVGLNYLGREVVEKSMTLWATLLTVVLLAYAVMTLAFSGESIRQVFDAGEVRDGWLLSSFQFSLYNVAVVPVILYCASEIRTRAEALAGGFFAGFMGVFPGLVFHITFMAGYPDIVDQELPTYWMIQELQVPYLLGVYVLVLFGTIVQTGVGVLHGLNERLDSWYRELSGRTLSRLTHAAVSGGLLLLSMVLASAGVVTLVASGYGTVAWGFLVVYIVPVFTIGVYRIVRFRGKSA
jgi:uncharacterized membrane protein YkvI